MKSFPRTSVPLWPRRAHGWGGGAAPSGRASHVRVATSYASSAATHLKVRVRVRARVRARARARVRARATATVRVSPHRGDDRREYPRQKAPHEHLFRVRGWVKA